MAGERGVADDHARAAAPGSGGRLPSRPNALLRVALKTPILLFDLRLGRLLGHRFLLLTHQGRRSGLIYRTPLEVIRYDPASRASIVIAAWGPGSDWFRNIRRHPALQVETAGRRYVPEQRVLTLDEADHELARYAVEHRLATSILERVFGFRISERAAERRAFAAAVRLVAFHPRTRGE
ncbi:MAG TPA: nitroreductase family deazaflavin-dependent oxidoreductase [Thermomicrobiaceae bacterium]|nr:nitroreductase family deazaflavin-dependent oxidoreductase [Thermomicrobiaceae bacterium]